MFFAFPFSIHQFQLKQCSSSCIEVQNSTQDFKCRSNNDCKEPYSNQGSPSFHVNVMCQTWELGSTDNSKFMFKQLQQTQKMYNYKRMDIFGYGQVVYILYTLSSYGIMLCFCFGLVNSVWTRNLQLDQFSAQIIKQQKLQQPGDCWWCLQASREIAQPGLQRQRSNSMATSLIKHPASSVNKGEDKELSTLSPSTSRSTEFCQNKTNSCCQNTEGCIVIMLALSLISDK